MKNRWSNPKKNGTKCTWIYQLNYPGICRLLCLDLDIWTYDITWGPVHLWGFFSAESFSSGHHNKEEPSSKTTSTNHGRFICDSQAPMDRLMQGHQLQKLTIQVSKAFPLYKTGKGHRCWFQKALVSLVMPMPNMSADMFWRAPSNVLSVPPTSAGRRCQTITAHPIFSCMMPIQNLYPLEISIQVSSSMWLKVAPFHLSMCDLWFLTGQFVKNSKLLVSTKVFGPWRVQYLPHSWSLQRSLGS